MRKETERKQLVKESMRGACNKRERKERMGRERNGRGEQSRERVRGIGG